MNSAWANLLKPKAVDDVLNAHKKASAFSPGDKPLSKCEREAKSAEKLVSAPESPGDRHTHSTQEHAYEDRNAQFIPADSRLRFG